MICAGDEFYEATPDLYEGTLLMQTWVITAIRSGVAFAVNKTEYTWIKRSTKTGDYGWSDSIREWDRKRFKVVEGPPTDWARTKGAAYTKALPTVEAAIKKLTKLRAQMTGQRTKARRRAST